MLSIFLSDSHNTLGQFDLEQLPDVDFVFHSGDFTNQGEFYEIEAFVLNLKRIKAKHYVIIAGNHEVGFDGKKEELKTYFSKHGIIYLQDDTVTIDGYKVYGTPWQRTFFDWEFNLPADSLELASKFQAIPDDVDILLTHVPPFGILDTVNTENVGEWSLAHEMPRLKNLKVHTFGHIHESAGIIRINGRYHLNASMVDSRSLPVTSRLWIGCFDSTKHCISVEPFDVESTPYYMAFKGY